RREISRSCVNGRNGLRRAEGNREVPGGPSPALREGALPSAGTGIQRHERSESVRSLWMIVALLLAACAGIAQAQVDADTIVVGIHADIQDLDPHNFRHRETETVLRNVFDGLVTRGPDMTPVPELAETITQLDETTWEFTLRRGVKFHDGSEMTAEDVAF